MSETRGAFINALPSSLPLLSLTLIGSLDRNVCDRCTPTNLDFDNTSSESIASISDSLPVVPVLHPGVQLDFASAPRTSLVSSTLDIVVITLENLRNSARNYFTPYSTKDVDTTLNERHTSDIWSRLSSRKLLYIMREGRKEGVWET